MKIILQHTFLKQIKKGVFFFLISICSSTLTSGQSSNRRNIYIKFSDTEKETHVNSKERLTFEMIEKNPSVKKMGQLKKGKVNAALKSRKDENSFLNQIYRIDLVDEADAQKIIEKWKSYENVEDVILEPKAEILYVPDDSDIGLQNHLALIQAYEAWDVTKGNPDIIMGISDTGVDYNHEDLQTNRYFNVFDPVNGLDDDGNGYIDDYIGMDLADSDNDPFPDLDPHGSMVAGVACASTDNGIGVAGVGFDSKYFPIKVFQSSNGASMGTYESINYAADLGFDVINLSWGGVYEPSIILQDIIDYAVLEKDMVVVAAAGNTNAELDFYPASLNHVLSVGMTNSNDEKATNGTYSYKIDLMAPGQGIYTTSNNDLYGSDTGSSYSAPMVAGTAALVRDVFPEFDAIQVMEQIRMTSDDIYSVGANADYQGQLGKGRLNMFRAVTEKNVASMRSIDFAVTGSFGEDVFFGDTVSVSLKYVNLMRGLVDAQVNLSSTSPFVEILNTQLILGAMGAYDTTSTMNFKILLSDHTPPSERIVFRMDYMDAMAYEDFQYFEFTTAPSEINFQNQNMAIDISSKGDLGVSGGLLNAGKDLFYQNQKVASFLGLMIGNHVDSISDNLTNDYTSFEQEQDFEENLRIKYYNHDSVDYYIRSKFTDELADNTNGFVVEQEFLIWEDAENEDFMIAEYYVTNTTDQDRLNMKAGLFVDFDLEDSTRNFIKWDVGNKLGYAESDVEASALAGLAIISSHNANIHAIDLFDETGTPIDFDGTIAESDKLDFLMTEKTTAGGDMGYNVAMALTADLGLMAQKTSSKIVFAYVFGNSLSELIDQVNKAKLKYASFASVPGINWEISSCFNTQIDLGNDIDIALYSDPLGADLIDSGINLSIDGFEKDSVFYYQEFVGGYASDYYQLKVNIANPEIEFRASPETLFLGDFVGNRVQFIDESLGAQEWSWDFGNGSFSTLKNPKVSYQSVGDYSVELSIVTSLGCTDAKSMVFQVKERGEAPIISDQLICKGSTAIITASNSTNLGFYISSTAQTPFFIGPDWRTPELFSSKTYYVSSLAGTEESIRVSVTIETDPVKARFKYSQDTLSFSSSQLLALQDQSVNSATVAWIINGVDVGAESNWSFDYSEISALTIEQRVASQLGCLDSLITDVSIDISNKPGITDATVCEWGEVEVAPGFGEKFVYYSDATLQTIIGKGKSALFGPIISDTTFYVTNISDYIESAAAEFKVRLTDHQPIIQVNPDSLQLALARNAQFFIEENNVVAYKWFLDGQFIETAASPTLTFDRLGVYDIQLISTHDLGCIDTTRLSYKVFEILGVDESLFDLTVYPNPAQNELIIDLPQYTPIGNFELYNALGQQFHVLSARDERGVVLNIAQLPYGMYILSGYSHHTRFIGKFYKE